MLARVPWFENLSLPKSFLFAPEAQRILAGGGTTGTGVVIAFAPRRGAGPKHRNENFRSSKFRLAPLPGCDAFALGSRWFHHRLISTALSGQKQESLNAKVLGNDKGLKPTAKFRPSLRDAGSQHHFFTTTFPVLSVQESVPG